MGLRFRAVTVVGASLLAATLLVFGVTATIVLRGFARVETADAEKNVARVREAVDREMDLLLLRANDWSAWDDCHAFVQDGNQAFVASNLQDLTLQEQKLNGMIFLDPSGRVVHSKFWDFDANAPASEPAGLLAHIAPGRPLNAHREVTDRKVGIVSLDSGPLIVASLPVITSERTGPIAGTIVWSKWLSAERVKEVEKETRLSLAALRADRAMADARDGEALGRLEGSPGGAFVREEDGEWLRGYALYTDVQGKAAVLLRARMPRSIHAQARASLWAALASAGGLAVLFTGALLFFVDRLVVRRTLAMQAEVAAIAASGDRSRRVTVAGNDEIGRLSAGVNDLLARVDKAEAELVRAHDEALQAAQAKARFLANVSHELRTPLNGIIGLGRLALETPLSPEQREYLQAIRSSGQTLLLLVNEILDFSKVEAGKLTLEKTPFDLRAVLEETLLPLRPRADERGILLQTDVASGVPAALVGDPLRLRQVLTNLAGNALKFTLQGSVTIEVRSRPAAPGTATLRFAVVDTGIGIPGAVQGKIFEAFAQGDSSTSRKFGGTGLGLAISRQIVELMGGQLKVESREGHGSTFWFEAVFPVHQGKVARERGDSGGFPMVTKRLRVLLADDNAVNRLVGQKTLEKLGHSVTVVPGGEEAVQACEKSSFDAILLDIQMPGVDGFEALRRIRTREAELAFRTPVFALTADAMPGAAEASKRAGFDEHLVKPLDPGRLAAALGKAVGDHAPAPVPGRRSETPTATAIVRGELLRHVGNDEALLHEIVGVFLKGAGDARREILQACESGDLRALGAHAHRVNGSLRTLGARRASAAADEVEKLAREGKGPQAQEAVKQLLKLLAAAVGELELLVGGRRATPGAQG
ncbi:MAG: response regulator [Planctomycetia bacterium]|nr:response regulator [Planctomycetia bacterium]